PPDPYTLSLHDALPISKPDANTFISRMLAAVFAPSSSLLLPTSRTVAQHSPRTVAANFRLGSSGATLDQTHPERRLLIVSPTSRSEEHTSELQSPDHLV